MIVLLHTYSALKSGKNATVLAFASKIELSEESF